MCKRVGRETEGWVGRVTEGWVGRVTEGWVDKGAGGTLLRYPQIVHVTVPPKDKTLTGGWVGQREGYVITIIERSGFECILL